MNLKTILGVVVLLAISGIILYTAFPERQESVNFDFEREFYQNRIDSLETFLEAQDSALLRADEQIIYWKELNDDNQVKISNLRIRKDESKNTIYVLSADSTLLHFTALTDSIW